MTAMTETPAASAREKAPSAPETGPKPGAALRRLLEPVRPRLVAAVVTAAFGAVVGVAGFVLVALAVRELLTAEPSPALVFGLLGGALAALLTRFVAQTLAFRNSHLASFDLEVHLRTRLADHLGRLPLGEVQRLGAGAVKKVVQDDVRALHVAVADATPQAGFGLAQPVAALVALAVVDWRLLLAVLVVVPVVVLGTSMAMKDHVGVRRRYDAANEAINAAVVEFVQGMPVVRTFDDGTVSFRRFARRVHEFTEATLAWQRTGRGPEIVARVAMAPLPTLVVVLAVGIWLTSTGAMPADHLLLALIIGTLPIESATPLMFLSHHINESRAGAARIAGLLDIPPLPEPARPLTPRDGSVRLEDVRFSYDGRRPALDGVDLDIPEGTVCALVGASGSGKSTVARLIPRFWDVTGGRVLVGGVDVRDVPSDALLRHVALVFQEPHLVQDTVAENIRLGRPDATDAEVEAAARAAQAHGFVTDLPDGYRTHVGERGGTLSGGQRQRITIARALLSDAPVVVLDEATAFADPENEAAIQQAVAELTRDRTVLVIAHRLSTVADADLIVVLDGGRVAERGTHPELLAAGGRYARLWEHHLRARAWGLGGEGAAR